MFDYHGMSPADLEARLEELQDDVDEYYELKAAVDLANDIAYLKDEGFIDVEYGVDGEIRCYFKEDPWAPDSPLESV